MHIYHHSTLVVSAQNYIVFYKCWNFQKNLLFLRDIFFCEGKMKNLLNFIAINILIFEMESQKVINYSADMSMTFLQLILLGFMSPPIINLVCCTTWCRATGGDNSLYVAHFPKHPCF